MAQDFATGFLQAFGNVWLQQNLAQKERAQNEEIKKLQKKKLLADLELQQRQQEAQASFMSQLAGGPVPEGMAGPPDPGRTVSDLLSRPEGQALALQSGQLDIKGLQEAQRQSSLIDMLSQQQAGGQAGFEIDPIAAMGGEFKGISPQIREITLPDGSKQLVRIGQVTGGVSGISGQPGGLQSAPSPLDMPISSPQEAARFEDSQGNAAPLGITPRQAMEQGFVPAGDKVTPEQAGRITGLRGARQIAANLRNQIVGEDGAVKISKKDLFNLTFGTFWTKGRNMKRQFQDAIDTVIRARTGAAATEQEMKGLALQFQPDIGDDDSTIVNKMDRLQQFLDGSLEGISLPPRLAAEREKWLAAGNQDGPLDRAQQQPADLPTGAQYIGNSPDGRRVYQLPDGSTIVESQ